MLSASPCCRSVKCPPEGSEDSVLVSSNGKHWSEMSNCEFFQEFSDIYTEEAALYFPGARAAFESLASTFKVRVGHQTAASRQVRIEEAAGSWEPLGPAPAWFTRCACLIWTWTITQLKKWKHISCFEVDLEEQEPRRCLFCISSHVSLMCRSGRWSGARTPENGGLDSKSQFHFFHALRLIPGLRCFTLFSVDLVSPSDDRNSLTGSNEFVKSALFMPQLHQSLWTSVIPPSARELTPRLLSPQWPLLVFYDIACLRCSEK